MPKGHVRPPELFKDPPATLSRILSIITNFIKRHHILNQSPHSRSFKAENGEIQINDSVLPPVWVNALVQVVENVCFHYLASESSSKKQSKRPAHLARSIQGVLRELARCGLTYRVALDRILAELQDNACQLSTNKNREAALSSLSLTSLQHLVSHSPTSSSNETPSQLLELQGLLLNSWQYQGTANSSKNKGSESALGLPHNVYQYHNLCKSRVGIGQYRAGSLRKDMAEITEAHLALVALKPNTYKHVMASTCLSSVPQTQDLTEPQGSHSPNPSLSLSPVYRCSLAPGRHDSTGLGDAKLRNTENLSTFRSGRSPSSEISYETSERDRARDAWADFSDDESLHSAASLQTQIRDSVRHPRGHGTFYLKSPFFSLWLPQFIISLYNS